MDADVVIQNSIFVANEQDPRGLGSQRCHPCAQGGWNHHRFCLLPLQRIPSIDALMSIATHQEDLLSEGDSTHVIELVHSFFERETGRYGWQSMPRRVDPSDHEPADSSAVFTLWAKRTSQKTEACEFSLDRSLDGESLAFISVSPSATMWSIRMHLPQRRS